MTGQNRRDDFPLQFAATGRFTRGAPRNARPRNNHEVLFLRSADGRNSRDDLWLLDIDQGSETRLAAVDSLLRDDALLPAAEQARRERQRESGTGITAFDVAEDGGSVVFTLAGQLYLLRLTTADGPEPLADRVQLSLRQLDVPGSAVDPRVGVRGIAWHGDGRLWVCAPDGGDPRAVTPDDGANWGLADFIAAEELQRQRGFWWSPDGSTLIVARTDDSAVPQWWISDPAQPSATPRQHRYPAAGTTNATVSLWLIRAFELDAQPQPILTVGPDAEFEYIAQVRWSAETMLAQLLSRDQRRSVIVAIDPTTGAADQVAHWSDDHWVDVVAGTPRRLPDGRILTVRRDPACDHLRAYADTTPISPEDLEVRSVVGVDDLGLLLRTAEAPETSDIVRLDSLGDVWTLVGGGWFQATVEHGLLITTGADLTDVRWQTRVHRLADTGAALVGTIRTCAELPPTQPRPSLGSTGTVRYAVLLPDPLPEDPGLKLPVLLLPYGGPHAQKVIAAGPAYHEARWWADRGYAVVIADGVGTPGVSPSYERAIAGDLATGALGDQLAALDQVLADLDGLLDRNRVGIMGWSFGGYLSALALLARPDRIHAAVAGAPVTDWRLYDTGYTERYLGDPARQPDHYAASDLIRRAPDLSRPLLLAHGLADDNVVAAHTLRLSSALLAAGRPHSVLPLTGVTHMTPQPVVAANLLRAQADYLDTYLQPRRNSSAAAASSVRPSDNSG
ncbi:MAG: prolyl oligopeptidase family serine peptidase [Actinobacteria bacterium]|nr:prolyl oligopeptidase family serine peptidase [Actinomycetota bacterium]